MASACGLRRGSVPITVTPLRDFIDQPGEIVDGCCAPAPEEHVVGADQHGDQRRVAAEFTQSWQLIGQHIANPGAGDREIHQSDLPTVGH